MFCALLAPFFKSSFSHLVFTLPCFFLQHLTFLLTEIFIISVLIFTGSHTHTELSCCTMSNLHQLNPVSVLLQWSLYRRSFHFHLSSFTLLSSLSPKHCLFATVLPFVSGFHISSPLCCQVLVKWLCFSVFSFSSPNFVFRVVCLANLMPFYCLW